MTVTMKNCSLCAKPFPVEDAWQRLCLVCWKESKGYALTKADKTFVTMRTAYEELREELVKAEARAARNPPPAPAPPEDTTLTQDRIKTLLKLAHPDKHQGGGDGMIKTATETTQWLLSLYRRGKL
jgi:hypothetical protein